MAELDVARAEIKELEARLEAAVAAEGLAKQGEANSLRRVEGLERAQVLASEQHAVRIGLFCIFDLVFHVFVLHFVGV
jgi:hypothetical protein